MMKIFLKTIYKKIFLLMKFKTFINKSLTFLKEAFSENGNPSSKRLLGGIIICVVMFCTTWSIMTTGMTDNNRSVIEIEIITAGALLGITSVTSIWKDKPNKKK